MRKEASAGADAIGKKLIICPHTWRTSYRSKEKDFSSNP
jgi:hypothetical protein